MCPTRRNVKRSKNGLSRNQRSTVPGDCVVFIFIDPDDEEVKDIMNNARGKLETPKRVAMLCKLQRDKYRGTHDKLRLNCCCR